MNFLTLRGLYQNYLGTDGIQKETITSQIGTNKDSLSIERNSLTEKIDTGKELYDTIRFRLIDTVYKNWRLNHVFWEQYSDTTQLGLMTHPFTGWTTLILLIVAESYGTQAAL